MGCQVATNQRQDLRRLLRATRSALPGSFRETVFAEPSPSGKAGPLPAVIQKHRHHRSRLKHVACAGPGLWRHRQLETARTCGRLASHESSSWNTLLTALKTLDSLRQCFTAT